MRIAFGTVAFVLQNKKHNGHKGVYSYLDRTDVDLQVELPYVFPKKDNGRYAIKNQSNFEKIPGCPIGYWVSENMIKVFDHPSIEQYATVITGMTIGDNNKYLRFWNELGFEKLALGKSKMSEINLSKTKWIPYSKGGTRRNWYGGYDYVVNWSQKDNFNRSKTTLQHLYLREALTWPFICSSTFSAKQLPIGFLWDVAGSPCFFDTKEDELYTLGFLISKVCEVILKVSNPTINVQAVDIARLPIIKKNIEARKAAYIYLF